MLDVGAVLTPIGTNQHPASVTNGNAQRGHEFESSEFEASLPILPPYRPPIARLALLVQSPSLSQAVSFRLAHLVRGGVDRLAQEWQADVCEGRIVIGTILMKLVVDELRYPGRLINVPAQTAQEREDAEMCAYTRLQNLQGRHVSHCYGAYSFEMPWGNIVTGILLEDLSQQTEPLSAFIRREHDMLQAVEHVDPLVRACFDLLLQVQEAGITAPRLWSGGVKLLDGSSPSRPLLVLIDFSSSIPAERYERTWAEFTDPEDGGPWQTADQRQMYETLQGELDEVMDDWWRRLMKEDVDYLHLAQHVRRLKEEEGV